MAKLPPLPVLGSRRPYGFRPLRCLDSDSVEFSHVNCAGQLRVIDFFFTTCPTICPIMSSQMARLAGRHRRTRGLAGRCAAHQPLSRSGTTTRPSKLKAYGERLGPESGNLETCSPATKKTLYDLARNGYFLTAIESDTAAGGIFHSDIFALVDRVREASAVTTTEQKPKKWTNCLMTRPTPLGPLDK